MIVAKEVTKFYGLKSAIQDVSFHVNPGEIVGLLGPNGAGKTTILKIVTCFMPPTSGRVVIEGMDTRTQSLNIRKKIGFLPENVPLYNELSVTRFLAFCGSVKGLKGRQLRDDIQRVTRVCGLTEHRSRFIRHLSKGLKQRVGLAQALLNDPPILILDEPTTGLDPAQIIDIRELIRGLGGDRTVLLSTHILPEVSQLCERVIIINQGRIIAEDSPKNLTDQIQKEMRTVLRVEGPRPDVKRKLLTVEGVFQVEEAAGDGEFIVKSRYDEDIRPGLARAVVDSGWGLREMQARDLSLEEVFIHLVTEENADT
ncbi:MAG: ATP-binding cassette domain-containing protein [Desulfobacteraceae bacterium]|nr:ATP-binding cassette domain-containing protein [Desulfobacteraceae bacterium]